MRQATTLVLALFLLSCSTLDSMLGDNRPTASIVGTSLQGLTLQGVDLLFDVELSNPYAVALPLLGMDYKLSHGTTTFLSGQGAEMGSVPANGKKVIPLRAKLDFLPALNLLQGVRPGAVIDYVADIGLRVDAPAIGELRLPIQKTGQLPIPTVPKVSVNNIRWDKLSLTEAAATLDLGIENTNDFPVDLSTLAYALRLAGTEVAGSTLTNPVSLASGAAKNLLLNFSLKPSDLGLAAFRMLSGSGAGYEIGGNMNLQTAFGAISAPFQNSGQTQFKK
ncbi:MAG: LEA type 2 family protein [Planctomycetes bacterium]|nr:LEA type 2 family protein [Planctomycetota bacterium]